MPTIHREGQYAFIFFSSDKGEPPHIHVKQDRRIAKFWLAPVTLAKNRGFAGHELNQIARLIAKNEAMFLEAWNDYFNA
jgi:hypothetical protein